MICSDDGWIYETWPRNVWAVGENKILLPSWLCSKVGRIFYIFLFNMAGCAKVVSS